MKRIVLLATCLLLAGLLNACTTTTDSPTTSKHAPKLDKMAAANVGNTTGTPNNDYMFHSPTYQTGQTAAPRIGR